MNLLQRALVGAVVSGAIALLAYRRGSLSRSGALAGLGVGWAVYLGGGSAWFVVLLAFFLTSSALGRVGAARKEATKREFSKTDTRDALQVTANGGLAAVCALLFGVLQQPLYAAGFLGALATATGDTWATELGTLARGQPRSLRTLAPVPRGTSGAVSGPGLAATLAGTLLVGALAALQTRAFALPALHGLAAATLGGFAGATFDSWLGATLQARYRCPRCEVDTEGTVHHCGTTSELTGGLRMLGNDGVNAGATLVGALAAMAVARLL